MQILEKAPTLVSELQNVETFQGLPDEALEWLVHHADYKRYEVGEHLFRPNQAVNHMMIILGGEYVVRFPQAGELRELGTFQAGYITGLLPFSRMKESRAFGMALEPTLTLELHRDHFTEMVKVSYDMVQRLVAVMSTRIRDFTQLRLQSEKLMSLGKLSAGLAHELNNPASAIVRSVEELYNRIHTTPEKFKGIMTMRVTPEETDRVNEILFSKLSNLGDFEDLSLLEQEEKKDELTDWLEDEGLEDGEELAHTFAEFDFSVDDLEQVREIVADKDLAAIMWWLESTLSLEKLVQEIQEASGRIADLIASIKTYTHRDQAATPQQVKLHEGIKSTITMLKHKIKKKQIQLEKSLDLELPLVEIFPGEMNQVWTNLIDNAIDAMDQGGTLRIRTYRRRDKVLVDIEDTGAGIPEDIQRQIFDPFFTTKGVGEGTGLGLEVTRRIVEKHHGTIEFESEPGKTTFTVCLPIQH